MNHEKKQNTGTGRSWTRLALLLALALLLVVGGVTTALALKDTTGEVKESLEKAEVSCEVNDDWSVTNTGNIPALIRVRVIVNRIEDEEGTLIPGDVPEYTVGEDWMQIGDYLYYKGIVSFEAEEDEGEDGSEGGESESKNVTTPAISISVDEGVRVTVLADAIQAAPQTAADSAWGVSYEDGSWS